MLKEELVKSNVPATLAEQVTSSERNNRTLNSEGVAVGDRVKIEALPEALSEFTEILSKEQLNAGKKPEVRKFVNLATSGDRSNLSLGALVGTPKRVKYFTPKYITDQLEGFDLKDAVQLPQREADAVKEIADKYIGTTFECVAMAENCGSAGNRTFYLWRIVED